MGLFAGLAWLVGRLLPLGRRGWLVFGGLAIFSAAAEWLQPLVGRSFEWTDVLYGWAGAASVCATWRWRRILRWAALSALCLVPLVWEGAMFGMEFHAFPVLAKPGALWAERGWSLNGVDLSISRRKGFRLNGLPRGKGGAYPGAFREPACKDWRGTQSLNLELFWPEAIPAIFAVRVDDRPENPPYAERFQRELSVTQGWNSIQIPAEEMAWASGGRPMRLDDIRRWGVFLVSDVCFDYFLIRNVRLERKEEGP